MSVNRRRSRRARVRAEVAEWQRSRRTERAGMSDPNGLCVTYAFGTQAGQPLMRTGSAQVTGNAAKLVNQSTRVPRQPRARKPKPKVIKPRVINRVAATDRAHRERIAAGIIPMGEMD